MILDKEYQTMYLREVDYLASHGVRYTFVKTIDNTRIYKYKMGMFKAWRIWKDSTKSIFSRLHVSYL